MSTTTVPKSQDIAAAVSFGAPAGRAGEPVRAPLDRYANNVSALELERDEIDDVQASRRRRMMMRSRVMWKHSSLERCAKCGRIPVDPAGVSVRAKLEGPASFSGLSTCSSVWSCPVCAPKILARRHVEVGAAVATHLAAGGRVFFTTYTVSHRSRHTLDWVWDGVGYCWKRVISGRRWMRAREAWAVDGFLRLFEVTYGVNGWHVHVHCLWFISPDASELLVDFSGLLDETRKQWTKAARKYGMRAPQKKGFDIQEVNGPGADRIARYFTDAAKKIALEFSSQSSKTRSDRTFAPWAILCRLSGDLESGARREDGGFDSDLELWQTWEQGSRGRKAMTWSVGLREKLELGRELLDEEIASSLEPDSVVVVYILREGWAQLVRRPHLIPRVLESLERGGFRELRELLEREFIAYELA